MRWEDLPSQPMILYNSSSFGRCYSSSSFGRCWVLVVVEENSRYRERTNRHPRKTKWRYSRRIDLLFLILFLLASASSGAVSLHFSEYNSQSYFYPVSLEVGVDQSSKGIGNLPPLDYWNDVASPSPRTRIARNALLRASALAH
jgi:hypothetical protein